MRVLYGNDVEVSGVLIVRPEGRLDASGAETFWDDVTSHITDSTRGILLDITDVSIMTSAGVAILIRLLTRLRNTEGVLAVFGASGRVLAVLNTVRIGPLLHLSDTEGTARSRIREHLES